MQYWGTKMTTLGVKVDVGDVNVDVDVDMNVDVNVNISVNISVTMSVNNKH